MASFQSGFHLPIHPFIHPKRRQQPKLEEEHQPRQRKTSILPSPSDRMKWEVHQPSDSKIAHRKCLCVCVCLSSSSSSSTTSLLVRVRILFSYCVEVCSCNVSWLLRGWPLDRTQPMYDDRLSATSYSYNRNYHQSLESWARE